jgi:thiamine-phosphate pyrophosphorylase
MPQSDSSAPRAQKDDRPDSSSSARQISPRILCYVTDRRALPPSSETPGAALLARIASATHAGVDWIQIREKDLGGRELSSLVRSAVLSAENSTIQSALRCRILVNDRLDVAIASGAAGVHLGEDSLPVREVVEWCRVGHAPAGFLVGRSCHSLEAVLGAEAAGASYVFYGPVFATPSKAEYGAPQGIAKLAEVCARARGPVLAIGGITAENAGDCVRAGAAGIAAIRLFQEAADLAAVVSRLKH